MLLFAVRFSSAQPRTWAEQASYGQASPLTTPAENRSFPTTRDAARQLGPVWVDAVEKEAGASCRRATIESPESIF